jgi:predicted P-loop ATPase/GTPase
MQTTLFKQMMKENAFKMCCQLITINPVTRLWRSIDANSYLRISLSEFLKVAEIAIAMVLGSVQDEHTFSTISFMKNRLRNQLTTNLELTVAFKS